MRPHAKITILAPARSCCSQGCLDRSMPSNRGAAFAGSRTIIDEIKRQVPVWKREEGDWKHEHRPDLPAEI